MCLSESGVRKIGMALFSTPLFWEQCSRRQKTCSQGKWVWCMTAGPRRGKRALNETHRPQPPKIHQTAWWKQIIREVENELGRFKTLPWPGVGNSATSFSMRGTGPKLSTISAKANHSTGRNWIISKNFWHFNQNKKRGILFEESECSQPPVLCSFTTLSHFK